ncbi:MAG: glycosyltransferase family 1 protein, partial [Bacteroidetes bacterium]|nr:glycosyltransferase family 1 protein [Bacteroidota bacterium]
LSDDLRMASGIATMSKELVLGTVHKYDWFQVGAAINHPEQGRVLDVSEDIQKNYGIADASVKILPWNGYGNADLIRQLINAEKPDAILHFTDPRYWTWLYDIEHEIRQNIPLLFYAIWDDLPDPMYNRNFYESCDWIGCISRQTYGIIKRIGNRTDKPTWIPKKDWQVDYVPHGINTDLYKPTEVPAEYRTELLGDKQYDFILYWSNRNIRRKQPADVIYAYKLFCEKIGKEKADKCLLLMHTQPVDDNGTDLPAVIEAIAPDVNIQFSEKRRLQHELNWNYNLADATINIANNEGFGLATAESVMAGTPIIVNVTGGLQDQCGFSVDGKLLTHKDYVEIGSLHEWRKWEGKAKPGPWAIPVWSRALALAGSVPTPYIWDDRVDLHDVADAIEKMYNTPREERKANALIGREHFINESGLSHTNMCKTLIDGIESTFENWKPRKRFEVFK